MAKVAVVTMAKFVVALVVEFVEAHEVMHEVAHGFVHVVMHEMVQEVEIAHGRVLDVERHVAFDVEQHEEASGVEAHGASVGAVVTAYVVKCDEIDGEAGLPAAEASCDGNGCWLLLGRKVGLSQNTRFKYMIKCGSNQNSPTKTNLYLNHFFLPKASCAML